MTRTQRLLIALAAALVLIVVAVWVAGVVRRRTAQPVGTVATTPADTTAASGRKIKARLYYVSMDGTKLTGVDREVPYVDGAAAQAQQIVSAQLAPVPAPLVSAIPPGTTLRALYLESKGSAAFVDLSKEASVAHTGGSQDEMLTVYAIVNALTANLPAITSVQLLVDGKEVDTLAGHIDLRKPLQKNLGIIEPEAATSR